MQSIGPKLYLFIVSIVLSLLACIYLACFFYQLGSPVEAEWWVRNIYFYKDYLADKDERPRILIAGGSNALFGVDGAIIEEMTGYHVVNLSSHAELDIDFYYNQLKEHMQKGDVVVMPLEGAFHIRNRLSDWFVNNMLAWGWDEYLAKIGIVRLCGFLVDVPKHRIINGLIRHGDNNNILDRKVVLQKLQESFFSGEKRWNGYSYQSLDRYGDMIAGEEPIAYVQQLARDGVYYFHDGPIADRFVRVYKKILDLVRKNDGKLILTWPVTMRNKFFDLRKEKYRQKIEDRTEQLAEKSIAIVCNPALFQFDVGFFFDTEFHLNRQGAVLRSENLALCLNRELLHHDNPDFTYDEAIERVQEQEAGIDK